MFRIGRNRFDEPGAEFWKWWPGARDGIAKAIVTGAFDDRIVKDINKQVQRVHPQMAWELQPGSQVGACILPVVRRQPGAAPGGPALARTRTRAGCDVGVPRFEATGQDADDAHGRRRPVRPRGDARERSVGRNPAAGRRPAVAPALPRRARARPATGGLPVPGPPAGRGRRRALDRRDRAVRGADRRADPGRAQGRGRTARGRAQGRRHMGQRRGHAARRNRGTGHHRCRAEADRPSLP